MFTLSERVTLVPWHEHTQPDGRFADVQILRPGQQTEILALPGIVVAVDELL